MDDVEIEVKVKAKNVALLEKFLSEKGKFTGEAYQKDDYFTPSHRDFMEKKPVEEWFRIRGGQSGSITYKLFRYDKTGRSSHAVEYETSVGSISQLRKILDALNFKFLVSVEKTRRTWLYGDYEIAIDSVMGLGDFIEVEYKGHDSNVDPKTITEEMIKFLKSVGCTNIQRSHSGYPYALLHPEAQEFENV